MSKDECRFAPCVLSFLLLIFMSLNEFCFFANVLSIFVNPRQYVVFRFILHVFATLSFMSLNEFIYSRMFFLFLLILVNICCFPIYFTYLCYFIIYVAQRVYLFANVFSIFVNPSQYMLFSDLFYISLLLYHLCRSTSLFIRECFFYFC